MLDCAGCSQSCGGCGAGLAGFSLPKLKLPKLKLPKMTGMIGGKKSKDEPAAKDDLTVPDASSGSAGGAVGVGKPAAGGTVAAGHTVLFVGLGLAAAVGLFLILRKRKK